MRVQDVRAVRDEFLEIGARILEQPRRDFDDLRRLDDFGAGLRENGDAMAERGESAYERDDDALRSAVAFDREPVMGRDHDVHRGPSITSFGTCRRGR